MKKTAVTSIICIFALLILFNTVQAEQTFQDVPEDHWAYEAVHELAEKGILSGYSYDYFKGEENLTRYEIAVILDKTLDYLSQKEKDNDLINVKKLAELLEERKGKPVEEKTLKQIENTLAKLVNEFSSELKKVKENDIEYERSITLNVEEKDPRIAYSNALVPIVGPSAAANYVRSTPVINPYRDNDSDLMTQANQQMIYNVGEIGLGLILDFATYDKDNINKVPFTTIGVAAAILHNSYFGKEMADKAVKYNEKLHDKFKWQYPGISIDF